MKSYAFFSELLLRLSLRSPVFFKRLQKVFYTLAGVAQLLVGLRDFGFVFPAVFASIISQSSAVLLFLAAVLSSLPVKDPDELQKRLEKKAGN